MPKTKYINKVYEGAWKVVERTKSCTGHANYKLVNIYNQRELIIADSTLTKLNEEKTTISKIIRRRIRREKKHVLR